MRLILIGSEYAGKTTLAVEISRWMIRTMGLPYVRWHNHFVVPQLDRHLVVHSENSDARSIIPGKNDDDLFTDEEEQLLTLSPRLLEQFQRHMIWRHLHQSAYREENDYLFINWYYADAVYAQIYYGYGESGSFADRRQRAREWDAEILGMAPDTVLALVHAQPDVIRKRMRDHPRSRCVLQDADVDDVLQRFQEEYDQSLIKRRFILDTTHMSREDCLHMFLREIWPHLSQMDRLRMMT